MTSPTKNSNPKLPKFLNQNYKTFRIFRGFEQLTSSIAWQAVAELVGDNWWKKRAHAGLKICSRALNQGASELVYCTMWFHLALCVIVIFQWGMMMDDVTKCHSTVTHRDIWLGRKRYTYAIQGTIGAAGCSNFVWGKLHRLSCYN